MGRLGLYEEALTESAIGAFFDVYNTLGFGFLENVYVNALHYELTERGHKVARQFAVRVRYKGREIARQRLDLVVDNKLVIEIKSAYDLHPAAARQLYNYLRATDLEVGLLLHFGPKPRMERLISVNRDHANNSEQRDRRLRSTSA
jgi:GxxExxY protein